MRTPRNRRALVLVLAAVACLMMTLTAFAEGDGAAASSMYATFWALVPPVVAIVLALITKEAYSSLFIGILVGALFQCNFAPVATLDTMINDGFVAAIAGNAGIFLFLVLLGIIVALVNASGGSAAFGRWAEKNIKTRVGAMLATFVLGILIFIDDYFNCLTVGSVMRPVTDGHKISRPKLAYLIDATAAPVCMIAPVSSWAAAVSGVAADLDTGISGIELFIKAIPYNFYSLLTFVFIIALSVMKFDYGPMQLHERNAQQKGDLGALEGSNTEAENTKGRVVDLIIPVIILFVLCTVGMIYVGGFFGVDAWGGTENAGSFIGAFGNTDAFIGLPWGGLVSLALIVIYLVARRVLTFKEAMACVPKGFIAMVPPITILTMAVSLKSMTGMLGADVFVEGVMKGASQGLYSLLPAVIFIVACLLAFASGTSWGTFGILIPIVVAVFEPSSTLLTIGISACLAGAVCGDHCSPISDTTIMASAGAQCDHVTHVSTQLPYAITVAAVSFVTFIVAGFVQNALVCLVLGTVLIIGALFVLRSATANKA
ncbi:MAG: Na+/H+ antiporter NhaC family protein [Oscillospiraceae bacterium]|jgi:tetracycline resistance efflux pump|nr:Na+/H+ antiporter NhaC family protein [Oscillospiraceae bacterium]